MLEEDLERQKVSYNFILGLSRIDAAIASHEGDDDEIPSRTRAHVQCDSCYGHEDIPESSWCSTASKSACMASWTTKPSTSHKLGGFLNLICFKEKRAITKVLVL